MSRARTPSKLFRPLMGGKPTGAAATAVPATAPRIFKCDEVLVSLVIREYTAQGTVIGEMTTPPGKCFRTTTDLWAQVDQELAAQLARVLQPSTPPPAPPSAPGSPPTAAAGT